MRTIDAELRVGLLKRSIVLKDEFELASFPLSGLRLPFADRAVDLWDEQAGKQFRSLFRDSRIFGELDRRMFNRPEPLVLRVSDDGADRIPWEAFQAELDPVNRARLSPLRIVDPDGTFKFSTVVSPMQVLALIGHPDEPAAFSPERAKSFLENVLNKASVANKHMMPPVVQQVRLESVPHVAELTRTVQPNVVIFFGHGLHLPTPRIRLDAGQGGWIPLSDFADKIFPPPTPRPPFWIFWACSLGEAESAGEATQRLDSPKVMEALGKTGAVSVLAMRSRIGVDLAGVMLEALISAFAAGEPLEVAAALSRASAIGAPLDRASDRMDYAAPSVWSRSEPVERISWGPQNAFPAVWAVLPLISRGREFPEFSTGLAPVDEKLTNYALGWAEPGRLFVETESNIEDKAYLAQLLGIAAVLRKSTGRPVVPIIMRAGFGFDQRLQLWAKDALQLFDPRYDDREIVQAVSLIAKAGQAALSRLLAVPEIAVIFSESPDRSIIWQNLATLPPDRTVIVLGTSPPEDASEWRLDTFMGLPPDSTLMELTRSEPLGCAILGVIEQPVSLQDVQRLAGSKPNAFDQLEPLLVRVGGRRILADSARRKVQGSIDPDIVKRARQLCVELLLDKHFYRDFELLMEIIRQQLALHQSGSAALSLKTAWDEMGATWSVQQRVRLFQLLARNDSLAKDVEDDILLEAIEAGVRVQETQVARELLVLFEAGTDRNQARRLALLSECWKADSRRPSSKNAMWHCAREALACAERAADEGLSRVEVLQYKNNLARLQQYFEHDYEGALRLYEEIRSELRGDGEPDQVAASLFAAASRNAAECLLDPAPRPINRDLCDRIEEILAEGLQAVNGGSHSHDTVVYDLIYTRARLLEAANDPVTAARLLAEISEGDVSRSYSLIAAIAADRLAWNEISRGARQFNWEELTARLRRLDLFDHAWAVRVAIAARIRGAKLLAKRGRPMDVQQAIALLKQNRLTFERFPKLMGSSDSINAAITYAGIDVLTDGSEGAWGQFTEHGRAQIAGDKIGDMAPQKIWRLD